ncbi:beta-glucanase, partial [Bacillus spizizenii]|nr:beta-glucanase [Bacillus spizizenii]
PWNGTGVDEWLGSYNGVTPLYAHYDWVRYTKK